MSQRERLLQVAADDLRQDGEDYAALKALMDQLYHRLLARDVPGIERINALITDRVEHVTVRADRRTKVLGAFGLGSTPSAMQRLIEAYPAERRLAVAEHWRRIGVLATECQSLNERNGRLLAMHREIIAQLTGHMAAVYAPR
ncbi:flagellar export chaperone FlgN [Pseudomonas sp. Marseille-QA0892]